MQNELIIDTGKVLLLLLSILLLAFASKNLTL